MEELEKGTLVQQRIKKMLQNKKKTQLKGGQSTKRLNSGNGDKHNKEDKDEMCQPQSALRLKRPASAYKAEESTTATAIQGEIDVKSILLTVFEHGVKLADFFKENRLEPKRYMEWLSNHELFLLSTLGKLKEVPEEKQSAVLEKQCIAKIVREVKVRQQLKKCEEAESRISHILEERIKALSKNQNN